MNTVDYIGSIGVFFILVAYFLNLRKYLTTGNIYYLLLNVTGSFLAALASYLLKYWPFIILEGCWFLISLVGLLKTLISVRQDNSHDN